MVALRCQLVGADGLIFICMGWWVGSWSVLLLLLLVCCVAFCLSWWLVVGLVGVTYWAACLR